MRLFPFHAATIVAGVSGQAPATGDAPNSEPMERPL